MSNIRRTTVMLDGELVDRAITIANAKTAREIIDTALKEFITNHQKKDIFELAGAVNFSDGYDYKALRNGECADSDIG